jgi:hypothetical protein
MSIGNEDIQARIIHLFQNSFRELERKISYEEEKVKCGEGISFDE